jgi:hypothetical protein
MSAGYIDDLISFWRCDLNTVPSLFAHPKDWPVLRQFGGRYIDTKPRDFKTFVSSCRFGNFKDNRLHLSLLPQPYCGDLRTADIVILLLNPGFGFTDYYFETHEPKFRRRLEKTRAQDFSGTEFPFVFLDPEYCWHGGFQWWEEKLRDVATIIARKKFNGRYLDALRSMSKRVASLELIPYHSSSFNAHRLIKDLPSVHAAKQFAQETLTQNQEGKTIIVTRQVKSWELPEHRNLTTYEGSHTRGASLGAKSPGGQAILERYGISGD